MTSIAIGDSRKSMNAHLNGNTSLNSVKMNVRAAQIAVNAHLSTVGELREALADGRLERYRNCGGKTIAELCRVADVDVPVKNKPHPPRVAKCPNCSHEFNVKQHIVGRKY
jgi:hypothetical protein